MIYEGLVICHPKEHCSTWDFCTHYIPHVKGDACSCDSCVPCDTRTLLQHRVKMKEANIAALIKWLFEPCDKHPELKWEFIKNINRSAYHNVYHKHRYLCPQCMAELKESVK